MGPSIKQKIVGIRPGEKIHEMMCTADDSYLTLEFDDHFVIQPTIAFADHKQCFTRNNIGEVGVQVNAGFEYSSGKNNHFLNVEEIKELNKGVVSQ